MRRQRSSVLIVLLALLCLFAINRWAPGGLYSFGGHGRLLNDVQRGFLALLALTHASLAGIMWTQRRWWDGTEASTFRFICVKAIFWGYFATTFPHRNGILLVSAFLLTIMLLTTIDLDIQLVRRYILGRRDDTLDRHNSHTNGGSV